MCSVVREELAGKVSKDDSSVFKRLEIGQVPDELVDSCFEISVIQHRGPFDELDKVVAAAAKARNKMVDHDTQLEQIFTSFVDLTWHLKRRLFNHIANFSHPGELKATRNIKIDANRQLKGEEYTTGFPKIAPDGTGSRVLECDSWMDVDWFVEVKPKESQGLPAKDATISAVVCQAADYARLHMSCHPIQLFSVGLLIFGRKFMVGIFDRDGVSLSPISDFCDGSEGFRTFIKVTANLSALASRISISDATLPFNF